MFSSSYHHNRALEAQSHLEHLARSGDFNALLHHNLAEAHVLQYETSPERVLRGNAFRNAASSARSMISTLPALRASASTNNQNEELEDLQQKLDVIHKHCTDYVAVHKSENAVAVFEAVCTFLGVEAVLPERPGKVRTLFGGGRIPLGWKENATEAQGSSVVASVPTAVAPSVSAPEPLKDEAGAVAESGTGIQATKDMSAVTTISNVTTSTETNGSKVRPTDESVGDTADQVGPDVPTVMPLPPKDNATKGKQPEKAALAI